MPNRTLFEGGALVTLTAVAMLLSMGHVTAAEVGGFKTHCVLLKDLPNEDDVDSDQEPVGVNFPVVKVQDLDPDSETIQFRILEIEIDDDEVQFFLYVNADKNKPEDDESRLDCDWWGGAESLDDYHGDDEKRHCLIEKFIGLLEPGGPHENIARLSYTDARNYVGRKKTLAEICPVGPNSLGLATKLGDACKNQVPDEGSWVDAMVCSPAIPAYLDGTTLNMIMGSRRYAWDPKGSSAWAWDWYANFDNSNELDAKDFFSFEDWQQIQTNLRARAAAMDAYAQTLAQSAGEKFLQNFHLVQLVLAAEIRLNKEAGKDFYPVSVNFLKDIGVIIGIKPGISVDVAIYQLRGGKAEELARKTVDNRTGTETKEEKLWLSELLEPEKLTALEPTQMLYVQAEVSGQVVRRLPIQLGRDTSKWKLPLDQFELAIKEDDVLKVIPPEQKPDGTVSPTEVSQTDLRNLGVRYLVRENWKPGKAVTLYVTATMPDKAYRVLGESSLGAGKPTSGFIPLPELGVKESELNSIPPGSVITFIASGPDDAFQSQFDSVKVVETPTDPARPRRAAGPSVEPPTPGTSPPGGTAAPGTTPPGTPPGGAGGTPPPGTGPATTPGTTTPLGGAPGATTPPATVPGAGTPTTTPTPPGPQRYNGYWVFSAEQWKQLLERKLVVLPAPLDSFTFDSTPENLARAYQHVIDRYLQPSMASVDVFQNADKSFTGFIVKGVELDKSYDVKFKFEGNQEVTIKVQYTEGDVREKRAEPTTR